ncbi:MAG: class I SAM-dependent methyltransferase [Chloroflexota bacterium]
MLSHSMYDRLQGLLRCPITSGTLRKISSREIEELNHQIALGKLTHYDGTFVSESLESGFISSDNLYVYPVIDDIVVLLKHLAIVLVGRESDPTHTLREEKRVVRNFYDQIGWKEGEGVKNVFVDALRYEDLRPVSQEYIHRCHLRVKKYLKPEGQYLLDVASGAVQYPEYLRYSHGYEYRICVDISLLALKEAKKKVGGRGIYVLADVTNLPIQDNVIDGVVSLHTIYHIPEDEQGKAVQELYRVLRPGSSAVIVYSWGPHSLFMKLSLFPFRIKKWLQKRAQVWKVGLKNVCLKIARRKPQMSQHPKARPYFYAHKYSYFANRVWGFSIEIAVWRSVNSRFTKTFIYRRLLGKQILRWIYQLEERFPHFTGRFGQYPLFVIRK